MTTKSNQPTPKYQSGKNIQRKSNIDMRKIDNGEIRLSTATLDIKKAMQEARTGKSWTQEDLARECGLPKDVIRNYENGKGIVKQAELAKINRSLGLNLKKPKPTKITTDDYL